MTHRDRIEYEPNPERRGRWLSVIIGLLGLWLVGAAVALDRIPAAFWNGVLVGAGLVASGAYNYYRRSNRELGSAGVATFAAVLGLWTLSSPFLITPPADVAAVSVWTDILAGLLTGGVATYSAIVIRARRKSADARPTAMYDRSGQ